MREQMDMKFYATLEFISGQHAAILTLTDQYGEWAGSGRVEGRDRSDTYELAYRLASLNAQSKEGRLERFSVVVIPDQPKTMDDTEKVPQRFVERWARGEQSPILWSDFWHDRQQLAREVLELRQAVARRIDHPAPQAPMTKKPIERGETPKCR